MASDQKSQLVLGFFLVGIALVSLSLYYTFKSPKSDFSEPVLARVERDTGKVTLFRGGFIHKESILKRASVRNNDSVETDETGEATLSFESAYRVQVLLNSLVTLERTDDSQDLHVVLIIKRGQIRIENYGREGELYISKNGEKVLASEYQNSQLAMAVIENPEIDSSIPVNSADRRTLSTEEIQNTLDAQRTSFYKCYTQLLQKMPQAKGQTNLSFTIENSGQISNVTVSSSQINNDDFKKCVKEVLNRVTFRSFNGPVVSGTYPLQFE